MSTRIASSLAMVIAVGSVFGGVGTAQGGCGLAAGGCAPIVCGRIEYVEKQQTILVPQWTTETRTVRVVEFRPEVCEKTITVLRREPYTETVTRAVTVKTVTRTVAKPIWRDVEQQVTVMVPYQEKRQGVRLVCQQVPVQETRTICRDRGQWEERAVEVACAPACGGCGPCGAADCAPRTIARTVKVWVPNLVKEEVPVTVYRTQMVEQPFEYTVTLCRPETKSMTVRVCEYETEEQSLEVQYTVCVPEQHMQTLEVTRVRCVPEQQTVQCTVQVPHVVEKQVQVPVCRMVPKTITCEVPVWVSDCQAGGA
jgi:hypothetical protein